MVSGLHTIWCQVSSMDRSVEFYRDVLGLKPGLVTPHWSSFDMGNGVMVALHPLIEGATDPFGTVGKGWYLGVACADLIALQKKLREAGVFVEEEFHSVPGGQILTFADPDGNPLQAHTAKASKT